MLWLFSALLVSLWILAAAMGIGGAAIHLLLVGASVLVLANLIEERVAAL